MDISQIILVGVISLLTLMLVFLGFQVFLVLRDLRASIRRANRIVDEIGLRVTTELLRVALGAGEKHFSRRIVPKKKKVTQSVEKRKQNLQEERVNGETNGEENRSPRIPFLLKVPRFFKGIPKRR